MHAVGDSRKVFDRLVTLAVFGSVARDRFSPESDIDLLIVVRDLPRFRYRRVQEFIEGVEKPLEEEIRRLRKQGMNPELSPVLKTPEEVAYGFL